MREAEDFLDLVFHLSDCLLAHWLCGYIFFVSSTIVRPEIFFKAVETSGAHGYGLAIRHLAFLYKVFDVDYGVRNEEDLWTLVYSGRVVGGVFPTGLQIRLSRVPLSTCRYAMYSFSVEGSMSYALKISLV